MSVAAEIVVPPPTSVAGRERINLLGLDRYGLTHWLASQGEKSFRANQILSWLHQKLTDNFAGMSNLSRQTCEQLSQTAKIQGPQLLEGLPTADGTRKWAVQLLDGNAVEAVFIPEKNRGTLCVSTQVGCAMACTFCATGYQGFSRHLTSHEIIGQLWGARRLLGEGKDGERSLITNVVLMGMGEPLANVQAVLPALRLMVDDHAYGLSRRKVTVSTAGWIPGIEVLAKECPVALAVSLHAPNDELRNQLVPLNRKYPLAALLAACREYAKVSPRGFVTIEYTMLSGINDDEKCLRELLAIARSLPCKINLIPFNPIPQASYRPSTQERLSRFSETLWHAGLCTTIRKTRGDEIQAACGQLAGQVQRRRDKSAPVLFSSQS